MRRWKNPKSTGFLFHCSSPKPEDHWRQCCALLRCSFLGSLPQRAVSGLLHCQREMCVLEHCLFYNHGCVVEVSFFWFRIAAGADCVCFWTRWVSAVIDISVKRRHTLHINSACSQWSWCAILYRIFYKNCAHCRLLLLCSLCTHNFTFLVVQLNLLTKVFEANSKIISLQFLVNTENTAI